MPITTRYVDYEQDGTVYEGFLAMPETPAKAVVLVAHAWGGQTGFEQDKAKRIDSLVSLCKNLRDKCSQGSVVESGNKKWQDIYLQTQALRKHNFDTFFNKEKLSVQINKTLELFLEFADSRQVSS